MEAASLRAGMTAATGGQSCRDGVSVRSASESQTRQKLPQRKARTNQKISDNKARISARNGNDMVVGKPAAGTEYGTRTRQTNANGTGYDGMDPGVAYSGRADRAAGVRFREPEPLRGNDRGRVRRGNQEEIAAGSGHYRTRGDPAEARSDHPDGSERTCGARSHTFAGRPAEGGFFAPPEMI